MEVLQRSGALTSDPQPLSRVWTQALGAAGEQRVDQFFRLAVTVAIALLSVSLGLLVYFAGHLAHSIASAVPLLARRRRAALRVARRSR